jgi:CheY-like chemotaxis protein
MDSASLMEEAGFTVFQAAHADEAIRLLELNAEISLIFTDVHMPGSMDGLKLAHYVRGRWPPVKIIVTSGQMKVRAADLPSDAVFVPKPYLIAEVASHARRLTAA